MEVGLPQPNKKNAKKTAAGFLRHPDVFLYELVSHKLRHPVKVLPRCSCTAPASQQAALVFGHFQRCTDSVQTLYIMYMPCISKACVWQTLQGLTMALLLPPRSVYVQQLVTNNQHETVSRHVHIDNCKLCCHSVVQRYNSACN